MVAPAGGGLHLEEYQLHQPGVALHPVPAGVVDHQQRLGASPVPRVPDRGVDPGAAAQETGARPAQGHDIQGQVDDLIERYQKWTRLQLQPSVGAELHGLGLRQNPAGVFGSHSPRGSQTGHLAHSHVKPVGLKLALKGQVVLQQRWRTFDHVADGIAVQWGTRHIFIQKSGWAKI